MSLFVEPIPFAEAIASNAVRTLLPTELRSRELASLAPELLARARFSAGVTEVDFLQEIDDTLGALTRGEISRAEGRVRLKSFLGALGDDSIDQTDLTDLRSDARIELILDTNLGQAFGRGQYLQGMAAEVLDEWPAQELVRVIDTREQRDWSARWAEAGGDFFGNRMVALKTSPIWRAISRFGQPHAPFDFNSGMDVEDLARDEAEAIGLLARDEELPAPEIDDFNADLQASPTARAAWLRNGLAEALQGVARFAADGVLRLIASPIRAAYNPDQPRDDSNGRWATSNAGGPPAKGARDSLGRRPAKGETSIPDDDNIARGRAAIDRVLARKGGSVPDAMFVDGVGEIEIAYGNTGDLGSRNPTHKGGGGAAHIFSKHPDDLKKLPEVIVKGQRSAPVETEIEVRGSNGAVEKKKVWKRKITHEGRVVVLSSRSANSKSQWLVTGYEDA